VDVETPNIAPPLVLCNHEIRHSLNVKMNRMTLIHCTVKLEAVFRWRFLLMVEAEVEALFYCAFASPSLGGKQGKLPIP